MKHDRPIPGPSDQPGTLSDLLPRTAGWMLLANLFLGSVFFLQLHWYLENIYRFSPWISFLSPERIDTIISVLWGAFMLHVGAPLARGRLEVLSHPENVLAKEAFGLFSHRRTALVAATFVAGVYALIWFSPALHLTHTSVGEAPVVVLHGSRVQFQGMTVPLLGNDMRVDKNEIVVSGKHRFYRVTLTPDDVTEYLLFPTHARVDLDRFFLRRDLVTTLQDANGGELASFTFIYDSDTGISGQCQESDIQRLFADDPGACATLMRRITADMSGQPDARLLGDFEGSVEYKGRVYQYRYDFGPELSLSIQAPEAQSELANNPRSALERFRSAGAEERELLVSEFRKDVGSLSSRTLETVFQGLFASDRLLANLRGTRSQRMDTLVFCRDVLALGVDHVEAETIEDLVGRILSANLVNPLDHRVFVPAIGALIALSKGLPDLQSEVLERVKEFVASLGARYNASKPPIVRALLNGIDDRASRIGNDGLLETVHATRRTVDRNSTVAELIDSQIRERLGEHSDPAVVAGLRRVLNAD